MNLPIRKTPLSEAVLQELFQLLNRPTHPPCAKAATPIGPAFRIYGRSKIVLVIDVASGAYKNLARVLAFDTDREISWDASREIAEAVLAHLLRRDSHIPGFCLAFLENHLGINYVRYAAAEAYFRC
jgi:hypothetical protein